MNHTSFYSPEMAEVTIPLRLKLRNILLYHGAEEVYTTLRQIFQEDYQFYQTLFAASPAPPAAPAPQPTVVEAIPLSQFPEVQASQIPTRMSSGQKIRVVKREEVAPPPPSPDPTPLTEAEKKAAIKRENAEKTQKKYDELVARGVTPASLMTKENLKKWVEQEGLTYTQIARDHVGLAADVIAAAAKEFGLQSSIAKKRAIIASKKQKGSF